MSVERLCVREVQVIDADASVLSAAQMMRDLRMGALLVTDEEDRPIGILTDRDLTVRVLSEGKDPRGVFVREVMTRSPAAIGESKSVAEALEQMRKAACRRLPVVDKEGRLVGVLGLDDVLGLVAEELQSVGRLLERERPWAAR